MKFQAAYYFLLLYVTLMVKPMLPIVYNFISHKFNGIEHISLVHAKYGNQHLQKEIADTDGDKQGSRKHNTVKSPDQVSFHLFQTLSRNQQCLNYVVLKFMRLIESTPAFVLIPNQGPPPKSWSV